MKFPILFLLTVSLAFAEVETKVIVEGCMFPAQLHGTSWGMVTNYAEADGDPGLGVGVGYRARDFKVDIYVYDSLNPAWAKLPVRQKIEKEKAAINDIFAAMTNRGVYSNVKVVKDDVVQSAGRVFDHVELDYAEKDNGDQNSHYYLSSLNGKILKIRITHPRTGDPALVPAILDEICKSFQEGK